MNARYPNLELLEYKARVALSQDEEFLKIFEEKKRNNKYAYAEIDAVMFPQVWGSTCTGFDVTEDGSPYFLAKGYAIRSRMRMRNFMKICKKGIWQV